MRLYIYIEVVGLVVGVLFLCGFCFGVGWVVFVGGEVWCVFVMDYWWLLMS